MNPTENPTDITELSLEEKEKFQEGLDKGLSPTISAQSLSRSDTPLTIPPVTPSTTAEGLSGIAAVTAEQTKLAKEQELKAQESQKGLTEEKGKLSGLMKRILGVQGSRTQLEEEAKLGIKAQKVTDVTNQIEASQRAQTNEIRALESANITSDAKANAVAGINRKYAFEQADLALIQSAANRDLDTASRIIDRKIQLQLEPLQTQLDFTKFFYQENKELFTKAEDRAFNAKISKLEKQYQTEKENKTAIANIQLEALKNGVTIPQSVLTQLNTAKDAVEATNILARNGISLQDPLDRQIKQAQLAKAEKDKVGGGVDTYAQAYADGEIDITNVPQDIRDKVIKRANEIAAAALAAETAQVTPPTPITAYGAGQAIQSIAKPAYETFKPENLYAGVKSVAGTVGSFFKGLFGQ